METIKGNCDKCLNQDTEVFEVLCYNPKTQKEMKKCVCMVCLKKLVEDYFNPTKTGSW